MLMVDYKTPFNEKIINLKIYNSNGNKTDAKKTSQLNNLVINH